MSCGFEADSQTIELMNAFSGSVGLFHSSLNVNKAGFKRLCVLGGHDIFLRQSLCSVEHVIQDISYKNVIG